MYIDIFVVNTFQQVLLMIICGHEEEVLEQTTAIRICIDIERT